MGRVVYILLALLLSTALIGCASNVAGDSDPPPGVRKNDNPNTGVKPGKPIVVGQTKKEK